MESILKRIINVKKREVEAMTGIYDRYFKAGPFRDTVSMKQSLLESPTGIIAEFKRRSPSKGEIHPMAEVAEIIPAYEDNGAAACSVLTDTVFFGGALTDLAIARNVSNLPLLRKDFIVSRAQIDEARLFGADAILLIAAALSKKDVENFTDYAHELGLEVLFEVHNAEELDKFYPAIDMVGVNNRDLSTFATDPQLSARIATLLPSEVVKVAESGLTSIDEVIKLRKMGYSGFLIGETFMKTSRPGETLKNFIDGTL